MKKLLTVAALMLLAPGLAFAGVAGTAHDLSSGGVSDELCIYCHTPHNPRITVPLWNHDASAATYTRYTSPTMDADQTDWTPGVGSTSISAMCLSCHDGTISVEAFNSNGETGNEMTGSAMVGTDLTNDHPVAFTYAPGTKGTPAKALATVQGLSNGVKLFGASENQVECASCHNPHDDATASPFLVLSNSGSAICVSCHNN